MVQVSLIGPVTIPPAIFVTSTFTGSLAPALPVMAVHTLGATSRRAFVPRKKPL